MRLITPRVVIAGLKGGSGKTTLSIGLISALRKKQIKVIPFKKGPDYIDAGWLSSAAKSPCYNLDPFLIGEEKLLSSFLNHYKDSEIAVIEGNRGLYDGMDEEGTFSTARLSQILKAPVVLIIDCTKMTRTTAAIVLGAVKFDPKTKIHGVVLNQVSSTRHESVIRKSIEKYTNVAVVGAIPRLPGNSLPERHMGLTPFQEHPDVDKSIDNVTKIIESYVDLNNIIEIANTAVPLNFNETAETVKPRKNGIKIGIVRDSAFQFYYPENIEELEKYGAKIVEINALNHKRLPDIDILYIGGGFPETNALALAKNRSFKKDLLAKVEQGLPVYAECGGLMYLGKSILLDGKSYPMSGVFPIEFSLQEKPEAHGYTVVKAITSNPFYNKKIILRGHEFHYSKVTSVGEKEGMWYSLKMVRGKGIKDKLDGICYKNVFATYTHVHALGAEEWVSGILRAGSRYKKNARKT